jgi:hypothetical protein
VQRFLCVSCGHTVSVLPGTRLTYRPLEAGRLQGFFDTQAGISCGLDPPPGLVEAGCLQRAWNRLLTRVEVLKDAFGQLLPSELHILHAVYFITCVLGNSWKFQVSNEARAAAWL